LKRLFEKTNYIDYFRENETHKNNEHKKTQEMLATYLIKIQKN